MTTDVLLAAVMGAQGLKGAVKVKTFTADPEALSRYGTLHDASGTRYEITAFRTAKPGEAVMSFKGIGTREAAEALRGVQMFVARDALPAPDDEDEFYHADLIGLDAFDSEGRLVGKVAAIHNFGASDVIAIVRADGDEILLAFTRETVPQIDIKAGRILIAVPEYDEGEENPHPNVE